MAERHRLSRNFTPCAQNAHTRSHRAPASRFNRPAPMPITRPNIPTRAARQKTRHKRAGEGSRQTKIGILPNDALYSSYARSPVAKLSVGYH